MMTCPFRNGDECDSHCALRVAFKCAIKVIAEATDATSAAVETIQKDIRQINQKT